ncbi:MAG: hypothetical protein J7M38_06015, partial [Armatimonadetes bacterium]|nr:hypothetical protein [Armatimonadota bacterium]
MNAYRVAVALLCAAIPAGGLQVCATTPGSVGVLLMHQAGPTALEVAYVDALVAEIPRATGMSAALLYDGAPLVRARGATLPDAGTDNDWSGLTSALPALASRLQLDYVLATSIVAEDGSIRVRALVAVRGGGTAQFSFEQNDDDPATAAWSAADGLRQAIHDSLPAPRDVED